MQITSTHNPTTLNLDKHFSDLSPQESFYLLNHEVLLNVHSGKGNNTGKGKPLPANRQLCDIQQPAGEVYTIGSYRSTLTNELYSWHYNSNGVHYILRTSNAGCEIIYTGECLTLNPEPRHSIEPWRAFMWIEKVCPNRDGKQLIWTDGDGPIGQIDVQAAIATNFFNTPFFDICTNRCAYIQMCVPEICGCISAEFIPLPDSEIGLNNFMLNQPFQIMVKHAYYDGRENEWSARSTTYYQDSKSCFDSEIGFPRCMKVRIPIGNPLVDKIKIGISTDGVNWFLVDTIEKYKKYNNSQEKWYERQLSEQVSSTFSDIDCSFDYIFCNDKQKIPIAPKEISRVRNPIPKKPQSILDIKDGIAFVNYIDGNCPLDTTEVEKMDIQLVCPDADADCTAEYVNVTVRAIIHDTTDFRNQFIYRQTGGFDDPDDLTETAYFGGVEKTIPYAQHITFGQEFREKVRNFIAYVEGTDYWAEGKQWKSNASFSVKSEIGVLPGMSSLSRRVSIMSDIASGSFYYQEFKIRVKKGTKGFIRLTSHNSIEGSGIAQDKSTYVGGIIGNVNLYTSTGDLSSIVDNQQKELYFDTCAGEVTLEQVLIIQDDAVSDTNTLYNGYITDLNGMPAEGVEVFKDDNSLLSITDHNGFYHFYSDQQDITVTLRTELDCATFGTTQSMSIAAPDGGVAIAHDEEITSETYRDNRYLVVKSKVVDCDGLPISGLRVAISGSKYKVTIADGYATFKIRNYSTRDRAVRTVLMDINGCIMADCNGVCDPCMPTDLQSSPPAPACYYYGTGGQPPVLMMNDLVINRASIATLNGLKAGGVYDYAIVVKGDCGFMSAAYKINRINIPKTQEKGRLSFCSFSYNGNGITFPDGANCLSILRSVNLNPYELQWKVDKIERTTDGKIKITIQSLNDYNTRYNLKTNTIYQWLKGDRVEFISNGDGTVLTVSEVGLLNYLTISPFHDEIISGVTDQPADYFNQLLIEDDGRLDDITEGSIIEIQRPSVSTDEVIYREICVDIPIVNNQLQYDTGIFTTFDTFLVNRSIGSFVGTFEHHSPSDFWGQDVTDLGKSHVANAYETERRYGRNISLNSPTQFNYFGDLVKRLDAKGQGDITAATIKDGKIILFICEHDNAIVQVADDFARIGSDGILRALPPDSIISDIQPKVYGEFGCQYDHIGSVYFGDGYSTWVDVSKNAYVKHDYNVAKDVAEGRTQSFFRIRGQEIENHNKSQSDPLNKYRFAKGFNITNGNEYLTIKTLRLPATNNEKKPYIAKNDTICYNPVLDAFLGFSSFTPEFYGNVDLSDGSGCAFVAYYNGVPYVHPIIATEYNRFFGIYCDEIMGVTLSQDKTKMKIPQAMEIDSDMPWFAHEITNDKVGFVSEIPVIRFVKNNRKYNAAFLFNRNSRSGLYGNNGGVPQDCRGFFVNILLIRDNTDGGKFNTIDNNKRLSYNESDSVILKYTVVESTGMTVNL